MLEKCPTVVMFFLALLIVDIALIARGQKTLGSPCNLSNRRGICRLMDRCQVVYEQLLSGKPPELVCGFQSSLPIVCCPTDGSETPLPDTSPKPIWGVVTQPTTESRRPVTQRNPFSNSRPARRMCAEYAKEVYTLVQPPVLAGGDQQWVNVSLCAIKSKKLIVGGTKAEPKEFPHMVAIGFGQKSNIQWNCGGTLISNTYVLTAAHCLYSTAWGEASWARVGDLNLHSKTDDAKPQERRIVDRIKHPNYKIPARYNDIALVRLESSVTFNAYVRPACLSLKPTIRAGEKAVATGWGLVDWFDEEISDDLLKVTLPVISYSQCRNSFLDEGGKLPNGIDGTTQLCAGQIGKDTCQGDSGGPLVVYSNDEECMYDVIAITSFGKVCGSVAPGIYTKIYHYLTWIENIVWPN